MNEELEGKRKKIKNISKKKQKKKTKGTFRNYLFLINGLEI